VSGSEQEKGALREMDEGTVRNQNEEASPVTAAPLAPAAPPPLSSRHEIEPTVHFAIVPGPARDTFLFYHMDASARDVNGLWDSCRFCISNLVWVNDHFVVTPNPCYLNQSTDIEERFAKIKRVLLNWYGAKKIVASLHIAETPDTKPN
jgi:hypothetical protein